MKPSLALKVSGIFALLVGLTFTFTSIPALGSRPDGYTDNGTPYYYAYPDEGTVDEATAEEPGTQLQMPPDYSMNTIDDSYNWPGTGWIYPFGGPGVPFGQHNIFDRPHREGFIGHDGKDHNFFGHRSGSGSHHNFAGKGVASSSRMGFGGTAHAMGGGHR